MDHKVLIALVALGAVASIPAACKKEEPNTITTTTTTTTTTSSSTTSSTTSTGGTGGTGGTCGCANCSDYMNAAIAGTPIDPDTLCGTNAGGAPATGSREILDALGACTCAGVGAVGWGGAGGADSCLPRCQLQCTGTGTNEADCQACAIQHCAAQFGVCGSDTGCNP